MATKRSVILLVLISACSRTETSAPGEKTVASASKPASAAGANEDTTKLTDVGLQFAEKMLTEHGEFYPYAAAITNGGAVEIVAATGGSDHPSAASVAQQLEAALRAGAADHRYRATALVVSVRMKMAPNRSDAVELRLDHANGYSAEVIRPYTLSGGKITYGTPFTIDGAHAIFAR